jgi:4-hydroxybenzoate polyprenyltransferase
MARRPVPTTHPVSATLVRERPAAVELLRSLRPRQWTKNLLVFAGLIFGRRLLDGEAVVAAALAFAVFCAVSGVVYLFNDVQDRETDRLHPVKSRRPIAAGRLSPGTALTFAAGLSAAALATAFLVLPAPFGYITTAYLLLLTIYSVSFKHLVILDVLTIAMGFVMRAWAGALSVSRRDRRLPGRRRRRGRSDPAGRAKVGDLPAAQDPPGLDTQDQGPVGPAVRGGS